MSPNHLLSVTMSSHLCSVRMARISHFTAWILDDTEIKVVIVVSGKVLHVLGWSRPSLVIVLGHGVI